MGLKEVGKWTFLHSTPVGFVVLKAKWAYNVVDHAFDGALEDGVKGAIKGAAKGYISNYKNEIHDAFENSPITAYPYHLAKSDGLYEGKKQGYNKASSEYEEKIDNLKQDFSEQKNEMQRANDELNSIIDGYEDELSKMDV